MPAKSGTERSRLLRRIVVGLVAVGVIGAAGYVFLWDPEPSYEPAPDVAAADILPAELELAAGRRVFFGHMSVGKNILSGVSALNEAHDVTSPEVVELPSMVRDAPGAMPELPADQGVLVHVLIGENRHPSRKLENFEAALRGGLADQVDVAILKLCYSDVFWYTDVEALVGRYTDTLDRLERDFPHIRFLHATVPLTTGPHGIKDHLKVLLGRDDNAARERYNAAIRGRYGSGRLLDIAAIEARRPDGSTEPTLYGGYSSDGAHLNRTGSALVAAEFIRLIGRAGG